MNWFYQRFVGRPIGSQANRTHRLIRPLGLGGHIGIVEDHTVGGTHVLDRSLSLSRGLGYCIIAPKSFTLFF